MSETVSDSSQPIQLDENRRRITLPSGPLQDPWETPLEALDVSDSRLYQQDAWRPYFERLRRDDPVHFTADSPFGPYWSITRHEDIRHVESHHEVFSSFPTIAIGDSPEGQYIENFIAMDPPKHEQQRKTVAGVVAPRNLVKLEPVIRGHVEDILDGLPDGGEAFDWVDRVSIELTTRMLATLFAFPFEDRRKLTYWSDISIGSPETTGMDEGFSAEEVQAGLNDMATTFMGLWAERAAAEPDPNGATDLITMLAHGEDTRDMIQRPLEFLGNIMLLIVGGNDTTRNSISGGVMALNQFPEEYDKLRADAGLIPNMVSEIIRWQTPVLHMRRTLKSDYEYAGRQMKAGEKVVMWYISGNRDEDVHEQADRLIIDRSTARQHASFGFGIHRCMGNRLAEMQLRVVWEEIHKRFRFIEVTGPERRLKSNFIRGIRGLPVRVHRH
ncbi:MAG: cytochrome P450 [Gammaproteobacteria bacterium]|nr:cytochrome P450 [Gammaproteobacteria bacterium]MBK79656.1 cytochrome P450 [Gammaproteobacteria bacterium]|tara:strand:- start:4122 stop:5447 length:1326 start_codon:yes stop_codon:yes gene_type:complete